MTADLKLRADVAVEVGWEKESLPDRKGSTWYRKIGDQRMTHELPPYELSLDACREVLAEIERRFGREPFITYLHGPLMKPGESGCTAIMWRLVNVTPRQICEAALQTARHAAVHEAKETDR